MGMLALNPIGMLGIDGLASYGKGGNDAMIELDIAQLPIISNYVITSSVVYTE